jgi:AcrR family transcriptional regulator
MSAQPKPSLRPPVQARSQATYRRLLDAAEELLLEKSFDETSVADICARAGLTVGAFYARFTGKEALLVHLEERLTAEMEDLVAGAVAPSAEGRTPREMLEILIRELVAAYNRRRSSARMLVLRSHSDAALKERLQDLNRRTMGRIAGYLEERARIRHGDPARARFALLAMRSVLRESILFKETWFGSDRLSEADLAREVTRMVAAYLGLEPAFSADDALLPAARAKPRDVATIDALMKTLYAVISGPAGGRDWDRLRSLYARSATILPAASAVSKRPEVLDVEGYIRSRAPFFEAGPFWEVEVARKTKRLKNLAQVESAYVARRSPRGPAIFHGTNLVQLVRLKGRWLVTHIAWESVLPKTAKKRKK